MGEVITKIKCWLHKVPYTLEFYSFGAGHNIKKMFGEDNILLGKTNFILNKSGKKFKYEITERIPVANPAFDDLYFDDPGTNIVLTCTNITTY